MKQTSLPRLLPVFFCFFVMGFVDLVGIATNYIKVDFELSDTVANLCPSMVFFWFLVGSLPTGMLMNRIGRKKTVLLSIGVTLVAMALPLIEYSFAMMMISFSLLGIGNTLMQVSLNPLISNIVSGDKLASSLTFGQFVKAIASFTAPVIAAWGMIHYANWLVLFIAFIAVGVIALIWLSLITIDEKKTTNKNSTFGQCFAMLKEPLILLSFIGIMCHVGIDVGTNVTAPKLMMERLGMGLSEAGYTTSVYFLCRTIGCFSGSFILNSYSARKFFLISVLTMLGAMGVLLFTHSAIAIYICIGMIGFGNSNIFSVIFASALRSVPEKQNEVSGLMIMGLFGGTIFPLAMGIASDLGGTSNQAAAVAVMIIGAVFLLLFTKQIAK